ncbi:MAG: hypothetical protein KKD28_05420 [Chloroflexi bacterium]|nr:hypothetical protein [Chloroflexota bacterium]
MKNLSSLPNTLAPYFTDGAKIILRFFLVAAVIIFLLHSALAIAHPYSLDYGEAPLIDQAMRLTAGENIYRPSLETPPFTITNYPPLYVISLIPFVNSAANPFQMGRVVSTVAALASAVFLALTTLHLYKNQLAAITTGVLFLSFPYVVEWSGRARIDCLALAFATAAIYVFAKWPKSKWGLFGGGLLLVAAIYMRQSYALAAPLAAFVWLWTHKKQRAIQLALLVGGLVGLLFLLINTLTEGGFFYNIVTANVNEFGWDRLQSNLEGLWKNAGIILVLSVVFLLVALKYVKSWALLAPFLVGAFISALTIGKIGSNVNYFLELTAALSLVGGAMIAWSEKHAWRYTLVVLLLSVQMGMLMKATMDVQVDWILSSHRSDFIALQRLEQIVQDLEGPIPADEYMGMLTLEGRPLYIQPFEVSQLANAGQWDQGLFLEDIANQKFEGILIHHFSPWPVYKERWTPEMLAAIEKYYRPAKTLAGTVVFLPQEATIISRVPAATHKSGFDSPLSDVISIQVVTDASQWGQPKIAVNPNHPDHLAVIATHTSLFDCRQPNCKVELWLYISKDGGQTWEKHKPFSGVNNAFYNGLVDFDAEDQLHALGIRDDTIVYNRSSLDENYQMTPANHEDVTRAQVAAKPWFRIHPDTGQVFVTLDAQEEDMLFVTPSLIRSQRYGPPWTTISRADLRVSVTDFMVGRANTVDDIQVLFGEDQNVSLIWTWGWEPLTWPRSVWMANSTDGGETFGEPTPILKTWGPINSTSANGEFALVYRTGSEAAQNLAVATTSDSGQTWTSSIASGGVPLYFDVDNSPGIGISPDGTIDLVFYAHDPGSLDCVLDIQSWQEIVQWGRIDPCKYNVYYTYSKDGGLTFSDPVRLNGQPVEGESLARYEGRSGVGGSLAVASTNSYAYPVWVGTPGVEKTQVYTIQIKR